MRVTAVARRSSTLDGPDGLQIIIPSRKNPLAMGFLALWLCGWAFGEWSAIKELLHHRTPGDLFMMVWLTGWTFGGAMVITILLWMVRGREIVVLRPDVLVVRRQAFGLGPTREYDLTQVRNLRVSTPTVAWSNGGSGAQYWGLGGGPIAFDYGAKTYRFGSGLDESEAVLVIKDLESRHSFAAGA